MASRARGRTRARGNRSKPFRPPATLLFECHRPDLLDPFVLGEAPDADMAAAEVAVPIRVDAARRSFVVDLPAVGENAKRFGDAAGASSHYGANDTHWPAVRMLRDRPQQSGSPQSRSRIHTVSFAVLVREYKSSHTARGAGSPGPTPPTAALTGVLRTLTMKTTLGMHYQRLPREKRTSALTTAIEPSGA